MEHVKTVVKMEETHKFGYSGKGIRIAILDTGVFLHRDIGDRIAFFQDYVGNKREPYDDNGHGTHISGILCGQKILSNHMPMGMCPAAELFMFKILDASGNGRTMDALKALDWILENYQKYKIRILNFSMGYLPNANHRLQEALLDKIETLWSKGIVVVTAAGNNGPVENSITVPGISRKVITVGAIDERGNGQNSSYSGRGPTACCIVKPEILAPGTNIRSLSLQEGEYVRKSGTSMAAPVVCGALALALEKNPALTPAELKILLYDSVRRIPVQNKEKQEKTAAWGILDVDNLLRML